MKNRHPEAVLKKMKSTYFVTYMTSCKSESWQGYHNSFIKYKYRVHNWEPSVFSQAGLMDPIPKHTGPSPASTTNLLSVKQSNLETVLLSQFSANLPEKNENYKHCCEKVQWQRREVGGRGGLELI